MVAVSWVAAITPEMLRELVEQCRHENDSVLLREIQGFLSIVRDVSQGLAQLRLVGTAVPTLANLLSRAHLFFID